jgi:hypothetical protein
MYGKGLGLGNTATGIAVLPSTGSNRALFVVAMSLLVCGVAIFVASVVMARKARQNAAN